MCGAVTFDAEPDPMEVHACHCEMCRRWTGSALLAVTVPAAAMRLEGTDRIRTLRSSHWAERGWCERCGSGLFYRVTIEGPRQGEYSVPLGLFDEPSAFAFTKEIFIDCKPASFAYEGDHTRVTRAEVLAQYAGTGK
jgi:hypothetical protein